MKQTVDIASTADLDALCALSLRIENAPHWARAVWLDALASAAQGSPLARIVLVCREGERVLGFVVASCIEHTVELESMVVDTLCQRQGIGRALWEALVRWAAARAAQHVALEVRASNTRARNFYRTMGFEEVGIRRAYYSHPAEDAVLMRAVVGGTDVSL